MKSYVLYITIYYDKIPESVSNEGNIEFIKNKLET